MYPPSRRPSAIGQARTHRMKTLGWREWATLPAIGVPALRVKIDTGARTSALNARSIELGEI